MEKMFPALIFLLLGGGFLILGHRIAKAQKPAHFFAGIPVKAESIRDVAAYNRACGRMWRQYGLLWLCCGCVAVRTGASLLLLIPVLLAAIPGSIWLAWEWNRIQNQHRK